MTHGDQGTVLWAGQLAPQVWKSWREHSTSGLSPWLVYVNRYGLIIVSLMHLRLIWGFSSLFLGVYAILQDLNIPLMVQPQLFGFLALVCWGQVCALF